MNPKTLRIFTIAFGLFVVAVESFDMTKEGARPLKIAIIVSAAICIVFSLIALGRGNKGTH